jgi:glycosyltransferase involved in cell wall biosynthesis
VIVNHFETSNDVTTEETANLRAKYGIGPQHKLVLYTGSFVALQALDLLLEAVPKVLARVPDTVFLLVGGTDGEIAKLRAQAESLGVASSSVLFERMLPQRAIPAYLGAADVLVSPRVQGINPPGKLLPYLASGKPVVATDTLVHNQILNAQCAILTPPDADGIANGVVTALTDPERVARVLAEATEVVASYCSSTARDAAYADVIAAANAANRNRNVTAAAPNGA